MGGKAAETMRFTTALAVSALIHAILAAGLAAWLGTGSAPDSLASLDVSSVELSFAEKEADAPAAAMPSPADAQTPPPAPREPEPPAFSAAEVSVRFSPEAAVPDAPRPEIERFAAIETPPSDAAREQPPADAPRQARVDAPPRPARAIRPDYPRGARQRGEQGNVTLEMRIGASGAVEGVKVAASCGYPDLDEAAVRAVRGAKFAPATSGGRAVASTARITLTFRLR